MLPSAPAASLANRVFCSSCTALTLLTLDDAHSQALNFWDSQSSLRTQASRTPYSLHPTAYTVQPTPYCTRQRPDPTAYTLHPTPYSLHHYTLLH